MLTAKELRQKYLDFFISKGHKVIPSASLIPENDPTVLFTTAGMHPLVPYLLGEKHPGGKRVANVQKCIRTSDIDEVGDNRHLTFFEMMGNWSFGDYFKKEAIEWSWEFLTDKKWLNLDPNRIYITVFKGEDGIPRDEESIKIWQEVLKKSGLENGLAGDNQKIDKKTRIIPLGKEDNFWIAGATGPCGGDTEMFYDTRPQEGKLTGKFSDLVDNSRLIEIWNDVFMEFNKTAEGLYEPLKQKNVDTGMGVERTITVLNGFDNVFQTELFTPILNKIEELSGKSYKDNERAFRIIADHIKAATMIMGDNKNLIPSNVDRGYVLRRLIRRAVRYGKQLGINTTFTFKVAEVVIDIYEDVYPEVKKNKEFIINQLILEEDKFAKTLIDGIKKAKKILDTKTSISSKKFNKIMQTQNKGEILGQTLKDIRENKDTKAYLKFGVPLTQEEIKKATITGKEAFDLYQSFGFPRDMMIELAQEKNLFVDTVEFREELKKHQELSRKGASKKFKGGLAEVTEQTAKLHTATHLLLAALRQILGSEVQQKGSNITAERLRFDFNYDQKLTPEQIKEVEDLVNAKIKENLPVSWQEMSVDDAKKQGAIGVFEHKYGEKVKVYIIGDFSKEICGGPHAKNTNELGNFKIQKEESSSAGIRRIKAILS
ncbi:MAG: alanine--tRNA ligase-related protein [Candidatus Parcubacteria bacterium]|nr:alanine--tRNA ligase-related protein [Candidatus Parcubacteria bacterium]